MSPYPLIERQNKHTPSSENRRDLTTNDWTQFKYYIADSSIRPNDIVAQLCGDGAFARHQRTANEKEKKKREHLTTIANSLLISPDVFIPHRSYRKHIINLILKQIFNEWVTVGCLYQYFHIDSHWHPILVLWLFQTYVEWAFRFCEWILFSVKCRKNYSNRFPEK